VPNTINKSLQVNDNCEGRDIDNRSVKSTHSYQIMWINLLDKNELNVNMKLDYRSCSIKGVAPKIILETHRCSFHKEKSIKRTLQILNN